MKKNTLSQGTGKDCVVRRTVKRGIDLIVSAAALTVLWPVMAAAALAIRLSMGAPVLFRDERAGLDGRPFTILKFRSMTDARGPSGSLLEDGLRLTRLGSILRKTSIDELPQFWNVVKGQMSLIGPRPLPVEYLDLYTPEQFRRHDVLPGMVGWASVNGRNANTWEKKFELDVWYVDNWSLLLDLKIFLLAIGTVISGYGVSEEGHATAGKFTRNANEKVVR